MKILVTGANGYLGRGIVTSLLDEGLYVVAASSNTDLVDQRAKTVKGNIFEVTNPFEYYDEPDILLHLAWRDGFQHYSDKHISELPYHYEFIKKMAKSNIKRIVIMGSMHEVGFYEGSIDDNTPCNPVTPYGVSKNALRELSQMLCDKYEKEFQWIRGFYIVGNDANGSSIFSKIVKSEMLGEKEFPFTNGINQFDFLDYSEFCKLVAMTVQQNRINGIINICSGYPEKIADRVERFISDNNYSIKLKYGSFPDRPYDSKAVWGNSKKIDEIRNNWRMNLDN